MGYYTSYSLEIARYKEAKEIERINIENVIKKIDAGSNKEEIIRDLEIIKNGRDNVVVTAENILEHLRSSNDNASYALNDSGGTNENCKWYDATKDMIEFSKKYPGWLFILAGEGEENDDMWKNYFLNGKIQRVKAEIVYAPFDKNKLENFK